MNRREALRLLGGVGLAALSGCAAPASSEDEVDASEDELRGWRVCRMNEMDRIEAAGSTPDELRRYEKIVVLMMENRSFDHYFGHLSLPRDRGGEGRTDVDGLRGDEVQYLTRPGSDGREAFRPYLATDYKLGDINHEWDACHQQFGNGALDGFIQAHFEDLKSQRLCGSVCGEIRDPMAYYGRSDTPILHQLFDNYALCDRWFSSVMGPTWPNRCYLHAATSTGLKENKRMRTDHQPNLRDQARTIWHELNSKCISAANYVCDVGWSLGGLGVTAGVTNAPFYKAPAQHSSGEGGPTCNSTVKSFEEACADGTLPTVSIIDPAFVMSPCDDHPPHDIKAGQAFISMIYKLLTKNEEQWQKTLFIITYDEHGSFYDHVKPPRVEEDERAEFRQLGFRVPALVIGPYVKKNYVSHVQYDHVSFLSTVTRRFGLTPLNNRVKAAADVRDCIDMNRVETNGPPPSPVRLQSVRLSESLVHESIADSLGQSELAQSVMGRPATADEKRRATDHMLAMFDRHGVATIRR